MHDNMWISENAVHLFHVDFRTQAPSVIQKDHYMKLSVTGNSVFSDEAGNLLYYTNSFQINNKIDSLLENGDSLNVGYYFGLNHYPIQNGSFFIPAPGDTSRCYLIYMYPEKYPGTFPLPVKVQYALIDRTANNGLGKVLEKNVPVITGGLELNFNHAGAVHHANGRDWWIIVPDRMRPEFYRILLTPEGFSLPQVQEIGFKPPTTNPNRYLGYNLFSPDGTKYAEFNYVVHNDSFPPITGMLQLYDFDRCTGLLSGSTLIEIPPVEPSAGIENVGIGYSPSSNRFYLAYHNELAGHVLVQYDIESDDIENSSKVISTCPPGSPNWTCQLGWPILAPNGKLYIGGLVDTVAINVIQHPDNLGEDCHFEFGKGFVFPDKYPAGGAPYFPNYRLGPIDGSVCDTLGIDNHPLAGFNWEVADSLNPFLIGFYDNSFYEPTDWFWDFAGTGTSTEVNPVHEFPSPGTYEVCLTVSNQFDSDTFCQNVTVDSLPTATSEPQRSFPVFFKISPNPATDEININFFNLSSQRHYQLNVKSVTGALLLQKKLQGNTRNVKVPLHELSTGIYLVELADDKRILGVEKLVVQQ